MKNDKLKPIAAGLCLALFLMLIALLKLVDVKAIGPNGSSVGFAALNGAFFKLTGENALLYTLSKILGYIAILTAVFFALLGLLQLIRSKSLYKVDRDLILLGELYIAVVLIYILFEKLIINYRPVLEDGELAASFPSSHTMLAIVLFGSAAMQFETRLADAKIRKAVVICCQVLMVLTILFRLFCGQHWLTDVIGGVLIGSALLLAYDAFDQRILN